MQEDCSRQFSIYHSFRKPQVFYQLGSCVGNVFFLECNMSTAVGCLINVSVSVKAQRPGVEILTRTEIHSKIFGPLMPHSEIAFKMSMWTMCIWCEDQTGKGLAIHPYLPRSWQHFMSRVVYRGYFNPLMTRDQFFVHFSTCSSLMCSRLLSVCLRICTLHICRSEEVYQETSVNKEITFFP